MAPSVWIKDETSFLCLTLASARTDQQGDGYEGRKETNELHHVERVASDRLLSRCRAGTNPAAHRNQVELIEWPWQFSVKGLAQASRRIAGERPSMSVAQNDHWVAREES